MHGQENIKSLDSITESISLSLPEIELCFSFNATSNLASARSYTGPHLLFNL